MKIIEINNSIHQYINNFKNNNYPCKNSSYKPPSFTSDKFISSSQGTLSPTFSAHSKIIYTEEFVKSILENINLKKSVLIGSNQPKDNNDKVYVNLQKKMLLRTKENMISEVIFIQSDKNIISFVGYSVDNKGGIKLIPYSPYIVNSKEPIQKRILGKNTHTNNKEQQYVICDLDGCLINTSWIGKERDPSMTEIELFDWFNQVANTDKSYINKYCLDFICYKLAEGFKLHFLTSREEKIQNQTVEFIENKTGLVCGKDFSISFRPITNSANAVDYKEDYISNMLKNGNKISLAIDDKPEINEMYHRNGIKTITWQNEPRISS